jgi:hypothetical protein
MAVGQHDPDEVLAAILDEFKVGEDEIDSRVSVIGEGQAASRRMRVQVSLSLG